VPDPAGGAGVELGGPRADRFEVHHAEQSGSNRKTRSSDRIPPFASMVESGS
jgi:hypothetical protein